MIVMTKNYKIKFFDSYFFLNTSRILIHLRNKIASNYTSLIIRYYVQDYSEK